MVRQMFELGILQSGFWHQFAMTAHSPVGMFPEEFGIIPEMNDITFANNDIQFKDKTGINHDKFSFGLKKSLFNYMHEICFDYELQDWFDFKIPKTKITPDYIVSCLEKEEQFNIKPSAKIVWIGETPNAEYFTKSKKGNHWEMTKLTFHERTKTFAISLEKDKAAWLITALELASVYNPTLPTFGQIKDIYEKQYEDFEMFWYSKPINTLRESGLLVL
jgi:hypothetical protein